MLDKKLARAFVADMREQGSWRVLGAVKYGESWVVTYEQDYKYGEGGDVMTDVRTCGYTLIEGVYKPRFDMVLSVRSQKLGRIR